MDKRQQIYECHTVEFKNSIEKECNERVKRKDSWGEEVKVRISVVNDLHASDALYHEKCRKLFFNGGNSPIEKKTSKAGRPEDSKKIIAFHEVCKYLEDSEECQFSLTELEDYMISVCETLECVPYSRKYLQERLAEKYGRQICFTELTGKSTIVNFRELGDKLLYERWNERRFLSEEDEKRRIVEMAGTMIRQEILSLCCDMDTYPCFESMSSLPDNVPPLLDFFLETVIKQKKSPPEKLNRHRHAIAESMILACRPRSFLPDLLLGVSIYMHRHYGSRQLNDVASAIGFACPYSEVLRYEKSVIAAQGVQEEDLSGYVQYVWDNTDMNIRTLNGKNTFHCMGGIRCVTPPPQRVPVLVPRLPLSITMSEIVAGKGYMDIHWYEKPAQSALKTIMVRPLEASSSQTLAKVRKAQNFDVLWLTGTWSGKVFVYH